MPDALVETPVLTPDKQIDEDAAATKLQALARGRQVRKKRARLARSAVVLQRCYRRLRQQRKTPRRPHPAPVVESVSGQRKEWAIEFQKAAGEGGLEKLGFLQAISSACGDKVSQAQADKLWVGFLEQSGAEEPMVLSTFLAICEAVLLGDAHAAEFAAVSAEEYMACSSSPAAQAVVSTFEVFFASVQDNSRIRATTVKTIGHN